MNIDTIPTEIHLEIFKNLNCKEKLSLCQSNGRLFDICKNDKLISREIALCYFCKKLSNKLIKDDSLLDNNPIDSLKDIANSYIGDDITKKDIVYLFKDKNVLYKIILDFFPQYFTILSEEYPSNYRYEFQKEMGEYIVKNWYLYKNNINADTLLLLIFYFIKFDISEREEKDIKQYIIKKDSKILQDIKDEGIDWFNIGNKENSSQKQFYNYLIL